MLHLQYAQEGPEVEYGMAPISGVETYLVHVGFRAVVAIVDRESSGVIVTWL